MRKGNDVRQYTGSIVFVLLSVAVPVVGAARKWPWPWWVWIGIAAAFLLGAVLSFPVRARPSSAFISGDATGSSFGNVYSDADTFVRGDARQAFFWNIIHRSHPRQR
jgi:hypothetical protein